jgi:hypothetical protein
VLIDVQKGTLSMRLAPHGAAQIAENATGPPVASPCHYPWQHNYAVIVAEDAVTSVHVHFHQFSVLPPST